MNRQRMGLRLLIYVLLYTSFALGLPQYHYATALMIAVIIKHKEDPQSLLAQVYAS
ncbi:MAG: hypothetical protein JSV66_06070 [Trueperaceae bacterium]|nr:MAG: hypothetical protein JSV66_06070 [Trueperaceae bacterium]